MDDAEDRLLYDFIRYGSRIQMDCTTKSTSMKLSLSYVYCMKKEAILLSGSGIKEYGLVYKNIMFL